ncbi:GMC family oxidoreductase [Chelativorans intermedius]|uniref:GMC family oxidoreductase n=1 Tax=Chelativorans intermedius TaxID=515947 RepID=A0ABV6D5V6_9HYPH|nr:GMC family oxidoreductase N-terminal domain-containing protein [Chelativorans intermedius]MCT8997509.1 GMC family oxidoreductase N-terminal domain-containing protein [Chelativorans intermedius]
MPDFIIVGAGSAGCVLANRLSEDPANAVLLIEAGGRDWHPLIHMPAGFAKMTKGIASWGWSTVPQKHLNGRVLWYTQARIVGGGSSINAQIYTRGNAGDYDAWEKDYGCRGWGYDSVLAYFKRAEANERFANAYHGQDGPLGVSNPISPLPICEAYFRAAQELGIPFNPDFNGERQEGVGYYQLTQRAARRSSTAVAYLKPALKRPNLEVKTAALVTRIMVENGRAVGVEIVERRGARPKVIRCEREVIVSCGAIGSPKLLMQSGIGPADHLKQTGIEPLHDLPGVGANLQDHLNLFVIAECTGDHTYDNYAKLHRTLWAGLQYILLGKGPAASSLFETGGFWYADDEAAYPDIQFHLGLGSGIEAGVEKLKNPGVTLNSAFLRPRSRGTVRLGSADPRAAPLIDPNYWAEPYDREMAFRGLRLARDIMRQRALKPFIAREVLPGPEAVDDEALFTYACRAAKTDHHPVGTCRMGEDEMAVVTPDLRLRGIEGLRVCDASVMPRIPSCNTNAPTIMIAEKGADLILGRPAAADRKEAGRATRRKGPSARQDASAPPP